MGIKDWSSRFFGDSETKKKVGDSEMKKIDVEETDEIYRLIKVGERVPNEVLLSHILDSWGKPNRSLCKYLAKQMKENTRYYGTNQYFGRDVEEDLLVKYCGSKQQAEEELRKK
uniref:Uncharacterized protein n=1 Tax=Fagus sylvatica TaxID=28930 RepID=A0A2N9GN64_FAGSY